MASKWNVEWADRLNRAASWFGEGLAPGSQVAWRGGLAKGAVWGASAWLGLYGISRSVDAFQRLRYGDVMGAGISGGLAAASFWGMYSVARHKQAESLLRSAARWITKL